MSHRNKPRPFPSDDLVDAPVAGGRTSDVPEPEPAVPAVALSGPSREVRALREALRRCGYPSTWRIKSTGSDDRSRSHDGPAIALVVCVVAGNSAIDPSHAAQGVERLHRDFPQASILVIAARRDAPSVVAALEAGAHGCLWRPFAVGELARALGALAVGHSPLPPNLVRVVLTRLHQARSDLLHLAASTGPSPERIEGSGGVGNNSTRGEDGGEEGRDGALFGIAALTRAERCILEHIAAGWTDKQIASQIGARPRTVQTHNRNIYRKLGVRNRTQAAAKFLGSFTVQETRP